MFAFLQGAALGFSAAVPLGPINIMIMTVALNSFSLAFAIGLGAMSADVLYLVFLAFGVLEYLQGEIVSKAIGIFGIIYLLYISFLIYKGAKNPIKTDDNLNLSKTGFVKNFAKGFFATLSNPYTVGFWLSVASFAKNFENPFNLVSGLVIAIFIWISIMPYVVKKSSKFISQSLAEKINYICATILVVFALLLAYKLLNIDFI